MMEFKDPTGQEPGLKEAEKLQKDTIDTNWVDLAEGRIGQVSQVEMAQTAQVQADADEKKAATVLAKLRSMPKAVSEKDEAAINKEREFDKEFQLRADERNKSLKWYEKSKWYKKLFGGKELKAKDIAQEEALRINKLISPIKKDELVKGERDALASELVERAEFGHKDEATIEQEEMVRKLAPDLVKALEEGNFTQAKKEEKKLNGMKSEERLLAMGGAEKLLKQRVDTLILSGDMEKMKELVHVYSLNEIGLETLAKLPKEITQGSEVQKKLISNLTGYFSSGHGTGPANAVERAQEFVNLKLMTPENVTSLFTSPESKYQEGLRNSISLTFTNGFGTGPKNAVERAQEFIDLGYITQQKANAIIAELKLKARKR